MISLHTNLKMAIECAAFKKIDEPQKVKLDSQYKVIQMRFIAEGATFVTFECKQLDRLDVILQLFVTLHER